MSELSHHVSHYRKGAGMRLARMLWKTKVKRILIAGVLILIPAAITINVLYLIFGLMDGLFQPLVTKLSGRPLPGLGMLITLAIVFLLGWLSTNMGGRQLITKIEEMIDRIPVASSVYGATKGVLEAVSRDQADAFKRVVLVEYPKANIFAIGFVTKEAQWGGVDPRAGDLVLVFIPTTPNPTSGFLLLVPRPETIEIDMTVEEGIRMVISGGILLPDRPELSGLDVRQPDEATSAAAAGPGPPIASASNPAADEAARSSSSGTAQLSATARPLGTSPTSNDDETDLSGPCRSTRADSTPGSSAPERAPLVATPQGGSGHGGRLEV